MRAAIRPVCGPILPIRSAAPQLLERQDGSIVFVKPMRRGGDLLRTELRGAACKGSLGNDQARS